MSGVRVAPRQEWDDLKLEESFCRASTVGQSAGATKLSAHSLSCSCLRIVGGWERDAASIIQPHGFGHGPHCRSLRPATS